MLKVKGESGGLTSDFAMWSDLKSRPADANPAAVYLTIAATLQAQREKDREVDDDSLAPQLHRPVALDPSNFVRFSDPLLQSCIWRAAAHGEMDYRRMPDHSEVMPQILIRALRDYESGAASALLDLLMGVAVGKIQLKSEASEQVLNEVRNSTKGKKLVGELFASL